MKPPAAVKARYADWRPVYRRGVPVKERLEQWSMPIPECGCFIWIGADRGTRYGSIKIDGEFVGAHRAAWEATYGTIPDGMHVLHKCDIGFCVNPAHLFLGTHQDNMDDKERKGRGAQPRGPRNGQHTMPWRTVRGDNHPNRKDPTRVQGERNGRAVLTPQQVAEIRISLLPSRQLGKLFGVSKTQILRIKANKLWRQN